MKLHQLKPFGVLFFFFSFFLFLLLYLTDGCPSSKGCPRFCPSQAFFGSQGHDPRHGKMDYAYTFQVIHKRGIEINSFPCAEQRLQDHSLFVPEWVLHGATSQSWQDISSRLDIGLFGKQFQISPSLPLSPLLSLCAGESRNHLSGIAQNDL